jgi:hypothetical protein
MFIWKRLFGLWETWLSSEPGGKILAGILKKKIEEEIFDKSFLIILI